MYCSDVKLAQSLEKDSVLEIPKRRALPWQSVWRRSPLPAWGGRVHGRESTCRGTGGGGNTFGWPPALPRCLLPPVSSAASHRSPCSSLLHGVRADTAEARGDRPARQRMPGPRWGSRWGAGCLSQGQGKGAVPSGALRNICRLARGRERLLVGRLIRF